MKFAETVEDLLPHDEKAAAEDVEPGPGPG
jgi:hypothetical protein